jgi:hypothetical protein
MKKAAPDMLRYHLSAKREMAGHVGVIQEALVAFWFSTFLLRKSMLCACTKKSMLLFILYHEILFNANIYQTDYGVSGVIAYYSSCCSLVHYSEIARQDCSTTLKNRMGITTD